MKFYNFYFYVNLSRNPIFGYNWIPVSVTVHGDLIFAADVNLPYYCCAKNNIFILLTLTCDSAVYRNHTVAFPQQELVREHVTMMGMCIAYLVTI